MPAGPKAFRTAIACVSTLVSACAYAEGIDTEHLFGFMIGTDVGGVGEREFQSTTSGRFSKRTAHYRAINQEFELEFVPVRNFRIELGSNFAAHDISGVPGLEDRSQLAWQGVSIDLRYRVFDRDTAPVGFTFAVESHLNRIQETSAAAARNYGTELALAFDRELIPNFAVAALNLIYQPEWTRLSGIGLTEPESTIGAAFGVMTQIGPGLFVGGETRYLRKYEGIGLQQFAGQALFVGPTAYFQLSQRSRLTGAWSFQGWRRLPQSGLAADLQNFERHQARLVFGVSF